MSTLPASVSREVRLDGETLHIPDRTFSSRPLFRALRVLAVALGLLRLCRKLGLFRDALIQVVSLDAVAITWEACACPWHAVRAITVAPYPFVDGSYVYCVEVRSDRGVELRLGPGLSRAELERIAAHLDTLRRQRGCARASQSIEDRDALDLLVGTLRDR